MACIDAINAFTVIYLWIECGLAFFGSEKQGAPAKSKKFLVERKPLNRKTINSSFTELIVEFVSIYC